MQERCLDLRVSQGFSRDFRPNVPSPLPWFLLGGILGFWPSLAGALESFWLKLPVYNGHRESVTTEA